MTRKWNPMLFSGKPVFSLDFPLQGKAPFLILAFCLFVAIDALYGKFLWNPLVFDDHNFFKKEIVEGYAHSTFDFGLRWFSYASLGWTYRLFGDNLIWFRMGNMLLHFAASLCLFFFLRRLFNIVLKEPSGLSNDWLAFFAALIFAFDPVSVYAAGYLIERSIVMAAGFGFLMLLAYMEGVARGRKIWFFVSALFYFLAVFSKEHAVMLPAVALALTPLLKKPSRTWLKEFWLPFALFACIGILVVLKAKGVLGSAYEIYGAAMIESEKIEASHAYALSMLTQSGLFFKYLFLWLFPDPAMMSVDMREPFALSYASPFRMLGLIAFLAYPVAALKLLLQGGRRGLAGFGLLFPWLLFMTELSTVRIQESFVLYRSYLWMGGFFSVLPFVVSKFPAKAAFILLFAASIALFPLAREELVSFSSPVLLWGDAAKLVEGRSGLVGIDRIYYNLGKAELDEGRYPDAIRDFTRVVGISPKVYQAWYSRGYAYYSEQKLELAIHDFDRALELSPDYAQGYFMRALAYRQMKQQASALADFRKSCDLGFQRGCVKWKEMEKRPF